MPRRSRSVRKRCRPSTSRTRARPDLSMRGLAQRDVRLRLSHALPDGPGSRRRSDPGRAGTRPRAAGCRGSGCRAWRSARRRRGRRGLLDHGCEHLARPAAGQRAFLDDDDPARLPDRREDGLEVERAERAQVDHLDRQAVRLELGRSLEASWTPFIAVTSVRSRPSRTTAASPSRPGAPFTSPSSA